MVTNFYANVVPSSFRFGVDRKYSPLFTFRALLLHRGESLRRKRSKSNQGKETGVRERRGVLDQTLRSPPRTMKVWVNLTGPSTGFRPTCVKVIWSSISNSWMTHVPCLRSRSVNHFHSAGTSRNLKLPLSLCIS